MKIKTLIKSLITFYLSLIFLVSIGIFNLINNDNEMDVIHKNGLNIIINHDENSCNSSDLEKFTLAKEDIARLKQSMDQNITFIYTILFFAAISFIFTYKEVKKKILSPISEMNTIISSFQNGEQNIKEIESNDDEIGVMIREFFIMKKMLDDDYSALEKLALTDPLTGILNRRAFFEISERLLKLSLRNKTTFSILILDIDFFKKVNDTYGHLAGDDILKFLVANISSEIRESDVFARFGGEEFILLLPDSDEVGASLFAEKLRLKIENNPYKASELIDIPITVSIGVSELKNEKLFRDLINRSDKALYRAKDAGRNIVEIG